MDWKLWVGFDAVKLSEFLPSSTHQGGVMLDKTGRHCDGCQFQCSADYRHQCFQNSGQVFCVAALCPNRKIVLCCRVHKSKASSVKNVCT